MKRIIAILLTAVLLLSVTAIPEQGSIRHMVTGDISEFVVDENAGNSQAEENAEKTEATIGTDIYLFVDPDTASYITFYVTDEDGNPIPGAVIDIGYHGVFEEYGVTDENGRCSFYLFRDTEYQYLVTKFGYEDAAGSFTATKETKEVHVVLRKQHNVDVFVVDHGEPVEFTKVVIDGIEFITDEEGHVHIRRPNGEYDVTVITEDGREIHARLVVKGEDVVLIVDIGLDAYGGEDFLVFNKLYEPEDYVLTEYDYGEEYDYPTAVVVEAQCEREQLASGDRDILKPDGEKLWAQRSLMPTGRWMEKYIKNDYDELVFTNEKMGIRFPLSDLLTEDMMRVWALTRVAKYNYYFGNIVTEEARRDGLRWTEELYDPDYANLDLREYDLDAIRGDFVFPFTVPEGEEPEGELIPDSVFENMLFEFRVTPVVPEELEEMLKAGMLGTDVMERDPQMLVSSKYYEEELRSRMADGKLSNTEAKELYAFFEDGILDGREIGLLAQRLEDGESMQEELEFLWNAAVEEELYRVNCWLVLGTEKLDITCMLTNMQVFRKADEDYNEIYVLCAAENPSATEDELDEMTRGILSDKYSLLTTDNKGTDCEDEEYEAGMNTTMLTYDLQCCYPEEEDEDFELLTETVMNVRIVDVRHEDAELTSRGRIFNGKRFYSVPAGSSAKLQKHFILEADSCLNGLCVTVFNEPDTEGVDALFERLEAEAPKETEE